MPPPLDPAERWARVDELFRAVLDEATENRASFLNRACGADTDLRRELDSLLQHHGTGDSFFEQPAIGNAVPAWTEGMMAGQYRIVARLGAGGMGEVFRAHDTRLDRDVALKTLPLGLVGDRSYMSRLRREAMILASLNHSNVATLYGIEETAGFFALVMEVVDGETLREHMAARRLTIVESVAIARQIADALEAAHRKGIIHRDLKPGNVMITRSGHVKVLDFGLAKRCDAAGNPDATRTGAILGTAGYLSPEQAEGARADARSDIFAFGAVLYEMLTGRRAFGADSPARTVSAVLRDDPEPIEQVAPQVPPQLARIVRRCLVKDPQQRYQNMTDVRIALEDWKQDFRLGLPGPRSLAPWILAAGLAAALVWVLLRGERRIPRCL